MVLLWNMICDVKIYNAVPSSCISLVQYTMLLACLAQWINHGTLQTKDVGSSPTVSNLLCSSLLGKALTPLYPCGNAYILQAFFNAGKVTD